MSIIWVCAFKKYASPVLGWKRLKSAGLKGRQFINVPGVPTFLALQLMLGTYVPGSCNHGSSVYVPFMTKYGCYRVYSLVGWWAYRLCAVFQTYNTCPGKHVQNSKRLTLERVSDQRSGIAVYVCLALLAVIVFPLKIILDCYCQIMSVKKFSVIFKYFVTCKQSFMCA